MLALAMVCVLRTAPEGFDAFLNALAKNSRISIHNTAGIVYGMPYAYLARVRAVPGVVDAVSWSWFGGAVDRDKGVHVPQLRRGRRRASASCSRTSASSRRRSSTSARTATARSSGA